MINEPSKTYKSKKAARLDLKKTREIIGFKPHQKQSEVLLNQTRFTTLCWGRRSGKTMLAAYIALKYLMTSKKDEHTGEIRGHNIWIVAPTYDLAKRTWDYLEHWVPKINKATGGKYITVNKSTHTMKSISGSKLALKSTDNPASLLGAGLDLMVVDEAARVSETAWKQYLYPTLTDRSGKAVLISTPWGKNWFYHLMLRGVSEDTQYAPYSYSHMKTEDNTAIPNIKEEVELARVELPANDFLQEYEAEFVEGAGSVFRGVRDVLYDVDFGGFPFISEKYNADSVYKGGVDLARLKDFTVMTMVDKGYRGDKVRVVAIDRFNEVDWKLQHPRLALMSEKYGNPRVDVETNNIGDVVIGELGSNFYPFTTTSKSKKELINHLAVLIEQKKISIPNIPVLVNELEAYSYEVSSNGTIRYNAPAGYHDDMVMSLALAVRDVRAPVSVRRMEEYVPDTNFIEEEY